MKWLILTVFVISCLPDIQAGVTSHGLRRVRDAEKDKAAHAHHTESVQPLTRNVRAAQGAFKTCTPNSEFRMDCNNCLCDNEGINFSCTRRDCSQIYRNNNVDRSRRDTTERVVMKCVAESVFDRECNVCRCGEDGAHAICTNRRCEGLKKIEEKNEPEGNGFRCNPGEQFKRECNDCSCSADGKGVFCTLRLCV